MIVIEAPPQEPATVVEFERERVTVILLCAPDNSLAKRVAGGGKGAPKSLSRLDASTLEARHGPRYFERLGLHRAYQRDGSVAGTWRFVVKSRALDDDSTIADLYRQLEAASFPSSYVCYVSADGSDRALGIEHEFLTDDAERAGFPAAPGEGEEIWQAWRGRVVQRERLGLRLRSFRGETPFRGFLTSDPLYRIPRVWRSDPAGPKIEPFAYEGARFLAGTISACEWSLSETSPVDPIDLFSAFEPDERTPAALLRPHALVKVYGKASIKVFEQLDRLSVRADEEVQVLTFLSEEEGFGGIYRDIYSETVITGLADKISAERMPELRQKVGPRGRISTFSATFVNDLGATIAFDVADEDEPRTWDETARLMARTLRTAGGGRAEDFLAEYFRGEENFLSLEVAPVAGERSLLDALKAADPDLFNRRVDDGKTYGKVCQNIRQPVVLTTEDIVRNGILLTEGIGDVGSSVAFGSSVATMKANTYACPDVWCPVSRVAMSHAQFSARDKKCPEGPERERPIVFSDESAYWRDEKTGKPRQRYVGFLDPKDHRDGLCMPCCYAKKKDVADCVRSAEARIYGRAVSDSIEKSRRQSSGKYVLSAQSTLADGRIGLLPPYLEDALGPGLYRVGHPVEAHNQPTLEAVVRLFGSATKVEELAERLVEAARDLEIFVSLSDGLVLKAFKEGVDPPGLGETRERLSRETSRAYVTRYSIDLDDDGDVFRESFVLAAQDKYLEVLNDPNFRKRRDHVEDLLTRVRPDLAFLFVDDDRRDANLVERASGRRVVIVLEGTHTSNLVCGSDGGVLHEQSSIPDRFFRDPPAPLPDGATKLVVSLDRAIVGYETADGSVLKLAEGRALPRKLPKGLTLAYEVNSLDRAIFTRSLRDRQTDTDRRAAWLDDVEFARILAMARRPETPVPLHARIAILASLCRGEVPDHELARMITQLRPPRVEKRPVGGVSVAELGRVFTNIVRPFQFDEMFVFTNR